VVPRDLALRFRLIEMSHGDTLPFLTRPGLQIAGLAISPDSRTVIALDFDGEIVTRDAAAARQFFAPSER
jgi:hypothetical protein